MSIDESLIANWKRGISHAASNTLERQQEGLELDLRNAHVRFFRLVEYMQSETETEGGEDGLALTTAFEQHNLSSRFAVLVLTASYPDRADYQLRFRIWTDSIDADDAVWQRVKRDSKFRKDELELLMTAVQAELLAYFEPPRV